LTTRLVAGRGGGLHVSLPSTDGSETLDLMAQPAADLGPSRLFADLDQDAAFFQKGSVGYSATCGLPTSQRLGLHTDARRVEPVRLQAVRSNYFEGASLFSSGSITLGCGALIRDDPVQWHAFDPIRSGQPTPAPAS